MSTAAKRYIPMKIQNFIGTVKPFGIQSAVSFDDGVVGVLLCYESREKALEDVDGDESRIMVVEVGQ